MVTSSWAKVIGVSDKVKTIPSNYELTNLKSLIKDYRVNLTDFKKLSKIINENSPILFFILLLNQLFHNHLMILLTPIKLIR